MNQRISACGLRAAMLFASAVVVAGPACNCGDFVPTPEAEAVVTGALTDLPEGLKNRAGAADVVVRAVSVDGAVVAETDAKLGESFSLPLGAGLDHFNLRITAEGGTLLFKDFVPELAAGDSVELPPLGVNSTAAAQIVERYAVRERASLSSTPPSTLAAVRENARGEDPAVIAFRGIVADIVDAFDPGADDVPGFDRIGFAADSAALDAATVDVDDYNAALEAAVSAALVPIVCDPSQVNVLFTVDVSGQGKDGNGAPQSIRQPPKEGKVFLGITLDPTSPVPDSASALRPRLTPNDPATEMVDDGTAGDEVAGDGVFSVVLGLPRGMRVLYKYTDGSPNEGFTGTEEWPGNARLLQIDDVLTASASGTPDCLVIRRDSFGDESSNKNFVNLHARLGGGDLGYDTDLGGGAVVAPEAEGGLLVGGLSVTGTREAAPLTPAGVPEARENGVCTVCPAPLTVSADDDEAPRVVAAAFLGTTQTRVVFSEDVDVQSAGLASNYLLVNEDNVAVAVDSVVVTGSEAVLHHARTNPQAPHRVSVKRVRDASLQQNELVDTATVAVGADNTPPTIVAVRGASIVEVNPASRPTDPSTGEVFVVTFSEELDRIAAENAANYSFDGLDVLAAFARGDEVYVVTAPQERGRRYTGRVRGAFDVAGNVIASSPVEATALSLSLVTFRADVDHAWTSLDGATKGLPPGESLYLTGTVLRDARGTDGADLRVFGRTDVAGLDGFAFARGDDGVMTLTLRLPPGTFAYKLAHGDARSAIDPPVTLETVTKGLATRNDAAGVAVDPVTLLGNDGVSYAAARLSVSGADDPGPGVLFKRENPDSVVVVGNSDRTLDTEIVGTWRDVPFGAGNDYDDGLNELPSFLDGVVDDEAPRLLLARARQ